jgi:hypothetical protein
LEYKFFSLDMCLEKFAVDDLSDQVSTCTDHSGTKKTHVWVVEQITDLFHTTDKVKTHQMVRNRGQWCGDNDLVAYLADDAGTVPLTLDLRITHERWDSTSNPLLTGNLHYPRPDDTDRPLNKDDTDKIRD